MNPCATILALCFTTSLFSIPFPEENWCRYCLWIPFHYWARSFLPRLYHLLEFSPSVVHTLPWPWSLDLNHLKGFCNLVEKCMLTIVDFRLYDSPESIYQYIVDGNIVTHGDCSRFPNAIESGIPMSRSLCALWPGLVEVSRPLGVYYPLGVCQREVDLHLLIHRPRYPYLREAESWCTSTIHLPLLLWTGSGVDFVGTSTLSGILLQDCRIVWHLYSQ